MKLSTTDMLRASHWPILGLILVGSGCVIEKIDAIIAEHGVTYWPSSTDEGNESSTSTSTGISTGTTESDGSGSLAVSTIGDGSGSSTEMGSSSTGPVVPICGNGVVENGEGCDDGNADPDDGCKECERDSIVFISSESFKGYDLGGLLGADQRCRSLAAKAGLLHPETLRAWLSTATMPAAERLRHSNGRYVLVNGLVVAQNWTSFTAGMLQNTITVDENSQTQDSWAWTGTLVDGQPAPGSEFCGDWDDDSGLILYGGSGRSLSTDSGWSFTSNEVCDGNLSIYCIEHESERWP